MFDDSLKVDLTSADEGGAGVVGCQHHETGRSNGVWRGGGGGRGGGEQVGVSVEEVEEEVVEREEGEVENEVTEKDEGGWWKTKGTY